MRIGDIEYTRHFTLITNTVNESIVQNISFALGIKVRPLLTRVGVFCTSAQAITGLIEAYLENSEDIAAGITGNALEADQRAHPIWMMDFALATSGMGFTMPFQTDWWKLLMPNIQIHLVASTLAVAEIVGTLHYRFAELTDDEIIEIAAQRAQG